MVRCVLAVMALWISGNALADCHKHDPADSDFPDSVVTSTNPQNSTGIQHAWYDSATDRYAHGVLGDAIEPSELTVTDNKDCTYTLALDQQHVFEDLTPRLANLDNSGGVEVVTIRSHQNYGAQIAVYHLHEGKLQLHTTTPYIGTSNRWLAPIGIADFNNDGDMDIAFIDRPHLAKVLRVWSYRNDELQQIANKPGYSNHRIGEDFISGGVKSCNGKITMVTADAYWDRILETTLQNNQLITADRGPFTGSSSLEDALVCR